MATTTPNVGLRKPGDDDLINVALDIGENMALLDEAIGELQETVVPSELVWNFRGDLTVTTGTPYYPMVAGEVLRVRLNTRLAGGSQVRWDLTVNGASIFGVTKPFIAAGQLLGDIFTPEDGLYEAGDALEPTILNAGGAVDLLATIEIRRDV